MRHKEHPSSHATIGEPLIWRCMRYEISDASEMPMAARLAFSEMKYGRTQAILHCAQEIAEMLLENSQLQAAVTAKGGIWLAASAYGAVPSAAAALTQAVQRYLEDAGWPVHRFKIERVGGFDRTNFGALGASARKRVMSHRKIGLEEGVAAMLDHQLVVVLDDLRCTGSHEMAIAQLLKEKSHVSHLCFAYCIGFSGKMLPNQEEKLNHASMERLQDVVSWMEAGHAAIQLNARLLKFVLQHPVSALEPVWAAMDRHHSMDMYAAALSADGYFDMARFQAGFASLEDHLMACGAISRRLSYLRRAEAQETVVCWHLKELQGKFVNAVTDADLQEEVELYSRFKFGDVAATALIVQQLTAAMIAALQPGSSLRATFEQARARGEFVSLTAPGVRNVVSASNHLAREVGLRVNAWLSRQGLPTMVIRSLGRLSSGRTNYAELSAAQRAAREKTTQTLIPGSEYAQFPTHVLFLDDVEVTGETSQNARRLTLAAGALSFHSVFAFKVDPVQAAVDAGIEHRMNQSHVRGELDQDLAAILAHADYQPVQRMLRLLLHPQNRAALADFLADHVSDRILQRLYLGAMSNDYLWILADAEGQPGSYSASLEVMAAAMLQRGLCDASGIVLG